MPTTQKYARVRDKSTGHHYTVLTQEAVNHPDAYEVLNEPATNMNGDPLPGFIPEAPAADNTQSPQPPRTGAGSGLQSWAEYAQSLGIDVPENATRDQVIDLVDSKENS